jgi:DNA-binding transcriptional regulator YhcF (GntR family)
MQHMIKAPSHHNRHRVFSSVSQQHRDLHLLLLFCDNCILVSLTRQEQDTRMNTPLYRQLAEHYLSAIQSGTLRPGERMPSVRRLMQQHEVSLSTALQLCRWLEAQGWLEARPRSGYFIRTPRRLTVLAPAAEPATVRQIDPAQYVGIHEKVSAIIAKGQRKVSVNLRVQPVRRNCIRISNCVS